MNLRPLILICCLTSGLIASESEAVLVLARPARVPGASLKEGRYVVRVLETLPDRYILQLIDQKSSRPLTTFLAVPDSNMPHSKAGAPVFWNNHGASSVVRGLWLPNLGSGAEFVFEKDEAAKLAKKYGEPVPAVDPDSEGLKPLANMNDSDRQVVTLWLLSAVAVTPNGQKTGIEAAKFVPGKQQVTQSQGSSDSASALRRAPQNSNLTAKHNTTPMPSTASGYTNQLLIGLCCLSIGLFLLRRMVSQRGY